ncbi:RTA1 like protein-domain-containing protein [Rhizoctonia solani]|nr:RTA1 like protein-domain-containing protein [Rhizoctonia solani]
MVPNRTLLLCLLFNSLCALAQESDTNDDAQNPMGYLPNRPLAVISGLLYLAVPAACLLWGRKRWARYMLTIMIGGVCYALGLFLRLPFRSNPHQLGLYIITNMFTVLSPCAFIATVYMLLGRLALHLDADEFLLVKARIITKIFVTSDVVTLLIQASGGGMSAMQSLSNLGKKIFLVGLIVQLISFILYMVVYAVFLYRMKVYRPEECNLPRNKAEFFSHWTTLAGTLAVSCIGILVRSVFRTIENSQGYHGYLATHEVYFYVLDTLPLFIATVVFVITWPPLYLTQYGHANSVDTAVEMGMSSNEQK